MLDHSNSLSALFAPNSLALVGASDDVTGKVSW